MIDYITFEDVTTKKDDGKSRQVSLSFSDISYPDRLCLLGALPHNTEITFDPKNAQKMIDFLQKIVDVDKADAFSKEHDMKLTKINEDVKNRDFFFSDGVFILVTETDQKNLVCMFDDKIVEQARDYADQYTPETGYKYNDYTDKGKYIKGEIRGQRTTYWSSLLNLAIWDYLEKHNTVTYMKRPTE